MPSDARELVELCGMLLEMIGEETGDDLRHGHRPKGGMQAAGLPVFGWHRSAQAGRCADAAADVTEEAHRVFLAPGLDRPEAAGVGLHPPERDRLGLAGRARGQDGPDLADPIGRELRQMGEDLAPLPALAGGLVGLRQAWSFGGCMRGESDLGRLHPGDQHLGVQGFHR